MHRLYLHYRWSQQADVRCTSRVGIVDGHHMLMPQVQAVRRIRVRRRVPQQRPGLRLPRKPRAAVTGSQLTASQAPASPDQYVLWPEHDTRSQQDCMPAHRHRRQNVNSARPERHSKALQIQYPPSSCWATNMQRCFNLFCLPVTKWAAALQTRP